MAEFCDSFDNRATADLGNRYPIYVPGEADLLPTITSAAGRNGTNGVRITRNSAAAAGANVQMGVSLPAASRYSIAFARRWSALPAGTDYRVMARFRDSGTVQCELRVYSGGILRLYRGSTLITGAESAALIIPGVMNHYELQVTFHNTTGAAELRLNGSTVAFAVTNVDTCSTANNQANEVVLCCIPNNQTDTNWLDDMDDYVVHDSATFMGDCRVGLLLPDAAGTYSQWTPNGAATLFECVDETPPDGDTTYTSSATVGQKETFSFQPLPVTAVIKYVQDIWTVKKTDTGTKTVAPRIKSGASEQVGTAFAPTVNYGFFGQMNNIDPATGATWTAAGLNACERGEEVIS